MRSKKARLKDAAWRMMSKYIRRKYADRDGNCTCYTCGAVKPWREMQAGHGISGRGNYVLFLEEVIRPQDYSCNVGRGGRYEVFIPKLIREYGQEQYERWVSESKKPHKIDYQAVIDDLTKKLGALDGL